MTLVLTWLFPFGICIGADSAISYKSYITEPSGRKERRILTGGIKILQIPKIKAGVSYWGEGNIGCDTTDVWISNFIYSRRNEYDNIHAFATLLQNELRELVPELTEPEGSPEFRYGKRGFHLAGFVEHKGIPTPTFYHIHNGQSETTSNINPRIINANHDLPPEFVVKLFSERIYPNVSNGAFYFYRRLFETLYSLFGELYEKMREKGELFRFPDKDKFVNSLEAYSEFVRFWIRLVRDVYALSNLPEIIGGNISVLSISPDGKTRFSTRL